MNLYRLFILTVPLTLTQCMVRQYHWKRATKGNISSDLELKDFIQCGNLENGTAFCPIILYNGFCQCVLPNQSNNTRPYICDKRYILYLLTNAYSGCAHINTRTCSNTTLRITADTDLTKSKKTQNQNFTKTEFVTAATNTANVFSSEGKAQPSEDPIRYTTLVLSTPDNQKEISDHQKECECSSQIRLQMKQGGILFYWKSFEQKTQIFAYISNRRKFVYITSISDPAELVAIDAKLCKVFWFHGQVYSQCLGIKIPKKTLTPKGAMVSMLTVAKVDKLILYVTLPPNSKYTYFMKMDTNGRRKIALTHTYYPGLYHAIDEHRKYWFYTKTVANGEPTLFRLKYFSKPFEISRIASVKLSHAFVFSYEMSHALLYCSPKGKSIDGYILGKKIIKRTFIRLGNRESCDEVLYYKGNVLVIYATTDLHVFDDKDLKQKAKVKVPDNVGSIFAGFTVS